MVAHATFQGGRHRLGSTAKLWLKSRAFSTSTGSTTSRIRAKPTPLHQAPFLNNSLHATLRSNSFANYYRQTIRASSAETRRTTTSKPVGQEVKAFAVELIRDKHGTYPPGSLTPDLIKDAEMALESWTADKTAAGFNKALQVLNRLVQEQEYWDLHHANSVDHDDLEDLYEVRPFLLNRLVDCWRLGWRDGRLDMTPSDVLSIVDTLETRGLMPDNRTLTMIVDGMILRGDALEAPLLAQWLLDRRLEQGAEDPSMRPDTVFMTNVIRAWAKSGRLEAPEMAEGILELMYDLYQSGWEDSGPNSVSYGATMEAWYHSRLPEANAAMERLLDAMKNSTIAQVVPDQVAYSYVINGWAHSRTPHGAQQATKHLQEMVQLYMAGNHLASPRVENFSRVMFALARQGELAMTQKWFEQLQELYSLTGNNQFKPDRECQKAMLIALAKRGACAEAQQILDDLVEEAESQQDATIMPRRSYFVETLVAWSKTGNPMRAAQQAENLLLRMVDLAKSGFPELLPDARCFERVMHAWSKVRHAETAKKITTLNNLLKVLHQNTGSLALKPSARATESAILAWSRSNARDAPERAEALLGEMEAAYSSGDRKMKPRRGVYTDVMQTWLRSGRKGFHGEVERNFRKLQSLYTQGDRDYRLDVLVYSVLLDSLAYQRDATKAEAVFDQMLDDFAGGNKAAKPDVRAFNKVLKSWYYADDPNKGERAEALFKKMHDLDRTHGIRLVPDRYTLNEMLQIWSKSESEDAAEITESYLRLMRKKWMEPTFFSYMASIEAWLKVGSPSGTDRAEALLDELQKEVRSRKVRLPSPKAYRRFLESIARSSIPHRNTEARRLLKTLPKGKVLHSLLP